MVTQRFFYCPLCGGKLTYKPAEDRQRLTCIDCGQILYENPVVGVLIDAMARGRLKARRTICLPAVI